MIQHYCGQLIDFAFILDQLQFLSVFLSFFSDFELKKNFPCAPSIAPDPIIQPGKCSSKSFNNEQFLEVKIVVVTISYLIMRWLTTIKS